MSKWKGGEGTGGRVQQLSVPSDDFFFFFWWRQWRGQVSIAVSVGLGGVSPGMEAQACFRRLRRGRGGDAHLHAEAVRRGLSGVSSRSCRRSRVARRSSRRSGVARRGVTIARVGLLGGHRGSRGGQHKLLAWLHKHTNTQRV